MTNQVVLTTQLATESNGQPEGSVIKVSARAERPLMNTVLEFDSKHPKVKKWIEDEFHDNGTRNEYGWHLLTICKELAIQPETLLPLAKNGPSRLFVRIKQHLKALENKGKSRKASQMKCAISSFVNFHNESPQQFKLNVKIGIKGTWERPTWGLDEWRTISSHINHRYRKLFTIGLYAGLGRKELVYLNQHLHEVQPVKGVPEACVLRFPPRKSNKEKWPAILPAKEIEELKDPLQTTSKQLVAEINLTQQFKRATERAAETENNPKLREKGTSAHVLRSIFRTVGGSDQFKIPEKILEQQMGHFDKYHYDRSKENLPERASALIPLWQYFREGPAVASSSELDATRKALEDRIGKLEKDREELIEEIESLEHVPWPPEKKSGLIVVSTEFAEDLEEKGKKLGLTGREYLEKELAELIQKEKEKSEQVKKGSGR